MERKKEQKKNLRLQYVLFYLHVVQLERVLFGGGSVLLSQCTAEVAHFSLQWWTEPSTLKHQSNPEGESIFPEIENINIKQEHFILETSPHDTHNVHLRKTEIKLSPLSFLSSAYSKLCSQLLAPNFMGADSFYVRVNLNIEPQGDSPSLGVSCDDIIHVTDTRYNGKYHWRCSLVDPHTAKPLQAGTMPNYNRFAK